MSGWIEITARLDCAPDDWSSLVDAFDRFGCPGSQIEDDPPRIVGYLTDVEGAASRSDELAEELLRLGATEVTHNTVQEEDWSELWKVHFKPRRIGRRLVIRPTWEDFKAGAEDIIIVLDPGQAFGTGDHPTSRLCLQLLESADLEGKSVADIGCGSGVLAIAAAKLGARSVVASDLDPLAVSVTRENLERNEVVARVEATEGFTIVDVPADVVVSNIISATLIRLAPEAADAVASGGKWIVSGIYASNWPDVRAAAEMVGFTLMLEIREDDWVAATFLR